MGGWGGSGGVKGPNKKNKKNKDVNLRMTMPQAAGKNIFDHTFALYLRVCSHVLPVC